MGRKKIESEAVCEIFEAIREYSKDEREKWFKIFDLTRYPEKVRKKANLERVKSEVRRLFKEYDDEVLFQERKRYFLKFEEYREAIEKSMVQWRMGLYRDLTRENILSYVDLMEFYMWRLAPTFNYELDETYILPYVDDILDVIYDIRDQFHYEQMYYIGWRSPKTFSYDQKIYNKVLGQIKGLYDAIEILIGKKPEVKVIKEVKEVIKIVREKPKPKPQPKSTKFICFNCDAEYDKPVKICEKCGFEFKKSKNKFISNNKCGGGKKNERKTKKR